MIGQPLHALLNHHYKHSRLLWVDKHTADRDRLIKGSDIVVLCTGQPQQYGREHFKRGAVVVDTGVYKAPLANPYNPHYSAFQGDLRLHSLEHWLAAYSPVPGGVGPLCVANVAANLLKAYHL